MSATDLSKDMPANLNGGAARNWINIRVNTLDKSKAANKTNLIFEWTNFRDTHFPEVVQNAVGPPAAPSKKAVGPPASSPTSENSVAQLQQLAPKNSGGGNSSTVHVVPEAPKKNKKDTLCRYDGNCNRPDCWFKHTSAQPSSAQPSGGGGKAKPKTKADTERKFIDGSGKIPETSCLYLAKLETQVGGAPHFPLTKGNVFAIANPDIAPVMCDNNMHNCPDGWKCLKCHTQSP